MDGQSIRTVTVDPDFNPTTGTKAFPFQNGEVALGITFEPLGVRFQLQKGPIKEVGRNGCQIDDMIVVVRRTLMAFQKLYPCRENALAITKLQEAEHWLTERTRDREARGVEGRNEK